MKKGWKCICTIGGVAALCAGASFVKDYRNMKGWKEPGSLPLHKLKESFPIFRRIKRKPS